MYVGMETFGLGLTASKELMLQLGIIQQWKQHLFYFIIMQCYHPIPDRSWLIN